MNGSFHEAPTAALIRIDTADAVFEALGGLNAVAELTRGREISVKRQYKVVFNWKATGAFPPKTYGVMIDALAEKGFYAPRMLWGLIPAREAAE